MTKKPKPVSLQAVGNFAGTLPRRDGECVFYPAGGMEALYLNTLDQHGALTSRDDAGRIRITVWTTEFVAERVPSGWKATFSHHIASNGNKA